jgi:hypothetical protein
VNGRNCLYKHYTYTIYSIDLVLFAKNISSNGRAGDFWGTPPRQFLFVSSAFRANASNGRAFLGWEKEGRRMDG